ncbi:MAG TPA: glycosyltransferase family 39 protein [Acidimicrobiales bacterium]|nr:glycosyltransferase family 39 protein [Acidimicrobiales bacterium]
MTPRQRWWLVGIVVVGAVLRVAWGLWAATPPVSFRDPAAYQMLGDNLARGDGYSYLTGPGGEVPAGMYPTAYYPPGYPLFLGALFWLADLLPFDVDHLSVAVGANVVLSTLTLPLVFALGRRLNGVTAGLVAAGALAILPNTIFHTGVALTESLFLVLLVLMLLLAVPTRAVARAPGWRRLVVLGVLFALSALVRPVSLVLLPAFLFLWWPSSLRVAVKRTAVVVGAAALVILPWTVRNVVTMDSPVLISANLGDNLCIGYNDDATGGFTGLPASCDEHRDVPRPRFEIVRQSDNIDHSVEWLLDHPRELPVQVFWRAFFTFSDDHDGVAAVQDYGDVPWMAPRTERVLAFAADGMYFALLGFAAVGAVAALRARAGTGRDRRQTFLILTMFLSVVPPLLTFGDPRFKAPLYPLLAIYAGLTLVAAYHARPSPAPDPTPDEPATATPPATPAEALVTS